MTFIQNFPLFTIVLSLFSGVISFALPRRAARAVTYALLSVSLALSLSVLFYNLSSETGYFVYLMGHYPAPIGNEISAGLLEPFFAALFEVVLLAAVIGGSKRIKMDIDESRQGFFFIMVDLVHVALIALCGSGTTGCHGKRHVGKVEITWEWFDEADAERWWSGELLSHGYAPHDPMLYELGRWRIETPTGTVYRGAEYVARLER